MNIIKRCRHGLMIYNRRDIWQGKSYEHYGEYSESEVALFQVAIRPGDTVLDVGANIGSMTIPFARIVGSTGLVVAFEPERNAFVALAGNVAINNLRNVFVFQQAVGAQSGTIQVPELNMGVDQNYGGLELMRDYSTSAKYPVPVTRVSDVITARCDFIKIDVEGMEMDVLAGAAEKIAEFRPILYVEVDRPGSRDALKDFLEKNNYQGRMHYAPFFNPGNFFEEKSDVFGNVISLNAFCWPSEKPSSVPEQFGLQEPV